MKGSQSEKKDLNIFQYTDYRQFLRDYYERMRKETSFFSYRYFSKIAGFKSTNFYKLVADGDRNLSAEGIEKFAKALKLNPKEVRHFRLLVLLNQSTDSEEKEYYTRQLFKSKIFRELKPLSQAKYDYYSKWFLIPLRELVGRSDFQNDPHWIAQQFVPHLTEKEVSEGLEILLKLNLIAKTTEGKLEPVETVISTGEGVVSQAVVNYHREMIKKGAEALDRFTEKERDISSLTMGVSQEKVEKIREMIREFRREIISLVHDEKDIEDVVQLNLQLFPLVLRKKGESHE